MATAAKITIAEVEHLVEPGELDPEMVHTPSVYVKRIFQESIRAKNRKTDGKKGNLKYFFASFALFAVKSFKTAKSAKNLTCDGNKASAKTND